MPAEDQIMVAAHDHFLMVLAVLFSILGAYASRELFDGVRDTRGRVPVLVVYDWPSVGPSLLASIFGSGAAESITWRPN